LRAGLINREQAKNDDMKNIITRSVGYELNLKGDIYQLEIEAGDGFLLCSDGLSGPVDDQAMFELLMDGEKKGLPLRETAERLVHAANARGGDDNVTVILVRAMVV
jgi:protein phosphatase